MMQKAILFLIFLSLSLCSWAQLLQDDFSDGDFSNNPIWTGSNTEFIVNPSFQLQTDNLGVSATSQLSTPAAIQDSTTWEFFVNMAFAPSTSNFTRVFLQSDNSDLSACSNGYYLQIGSAGTLDSIEIYRLDNATATKIFGATAGQVATNPNVRIRVIRDNLGQWELFVDYSGGTAFVSEGSFNDANHNTGSYFGFSATYTTTRGDKFYYDDVFVSPLLVDLTAPQIDSVYAISSTEVEVLFNEAVEINTASDILNYSLDNGVSVLSAQIDGINPNLVHLTTSTLISGQSYDLTVVNIEDLNANVMSASSQSFIYVNVVAAGFQDLIINEIFADPTPQVGLPNAEYVEIYNRSNNVIDLSGMMLNDGSDKNLPSILIQPGEQIAFCAASNFTLFSSFSNVYSVSSLTLTNGGELLFLKDASGNTIDSIQYDLSWYQDNIKDDGGWSLELINPNLVCKGESNWMASVDPSGGTPGLENSVFNNTADTLGPLLISIDFVDSNTVQLIFNETLGSNVTDVLNYTIAGFNVQSVQFVQPDQVLLFLDNNMIDQTNYTLNIDLLTDCSGNAILQTSANFTYYEIVQAAFNDLIFSEIMADPSPVVGLPEAEYLELFNRSSKTIDLANYTLFESTNKILPSRIIQPGEYVILCSASNASLFNTFGNVVSLSSLSLTNGGEQLLLYNSNGLLLDSLEYNDDWYQDNAKDDGGWSLSLINPNQICKGANNWRAAIANAGGTPGSENQVFDDELDTDPPSLLNVRQYGNNQILVEFDDVMDVNACDPANYSVDNGMVIVSLICLSDHQVILTLGTVMTDQTIYTITVNNLSDCIGNLLASSTSSMTYYESGAASHYDIIINEIMADPNPVVGLPEKEYIELYNRSSKTFNLEGFTIKDGSSVVCTLPFFILGPSEYICIYSNSDTVGFSSFGNVAPSSPFPDLNTSDLIILQDQTGEVIDAISYELSWYQNADKDDGGWSLERINPDRPCEGIDNWRASENLLGGTPCQQNSIFDISPDDISPDALRAFPLSADSIRIYFSEALDDQQAININNYSIDDPNIQILNAYVESPFYNSVVLILSTPIVLGQTYTITMSAAFLDCVGNPIALKNYVRVALAQPINTGDVILNEILFNPVTGNKDFVELYNRSDKVLNSADLILSNAQIIDGNLQNASALQTRPIETDWLIFPQEFLVVTESAELVRAQYQTPNPDWFIDNDLPTFDDNEGAVFLYAAYDSSFIDSFGQTQVLYLAKPLDYFEYLDDYHFPLIDDKNGVSLERIDYEATTNDPNNWHSAASDVGYATPAYQNSSFYINNITGEDLIYLAEDVISPDGDGYQDFLLINYNVDAPGYVVDISIYDAKGVLVKNLVNGELLNYEGSFQWDGSTNQGDKARIGIHIVHIRAFNPNGELRTFKKTCVVAGKMN